MGSPKIRGQFWVVQKIVDSRATFDMFHRSNAHFVIILQKIILSEKYVKMNVLDSRGQSWTVQKNRGQSKNSWTVAPILLCFIAQMLKMIIFVKNRIECIYYNYVCK